MVIIIYSFVLGYSLKKERKEKKVKEKKDRRKEIVCVRINAF